MPLSIPTYGLAGGSTAPWQFILSKMDGTDIGDITRVKERTLEFWLNKPTTMSFKMPITHPRAADLLNPSGGQELLIKAYKRGILKETFVTLSGQLVGKNGEESAIAVNCQQAGYRRITKRLFAKTREGLTLTGDRTACVAAALADLNASSDSRIRMGGVGPTAIVSAGPYRYQDFYSWLNEFGASVTGYDHWISATDPLLEPSGVCGYLNLSSLRGAMRPNAIFEFGTTHANAREYAYGWDAINRLTSAVSLPTDFPDNASIPIVERPAGAQAVLESSYGRQEEVIDSSLVDTSLRTQLLDDHLNVRAYPRQVFTIHPEVNDDTGRVPDFLFDYDIGDLVEGRVVDSGVVLIDGVVRVYGSKVELDEAGVETITLSMVDDS